MESRRHQLRDKDSLGECKILSVNPWYVPDQGEPAEGVAVMLESISHNVAAGGRTNTVGECVLTTYRPNDGTVVGEHRVRLDKLVITGYDGNGMPIEVAMMPAEYADFATSGLTVTVSEKGKNEITFEVDPPPKS